MRESHEVSLKTDLLSERGRPRPQHCYQCAIEFRGTVYLVRAGGDARAPTCSRLPPDLDHVCNWADNEQRIERCVDNLHQPEHEFGKRNQKCNDALAPLGFHGCLRVCDHEEHKQLIHRTRYRCDFRLPRIANDPATQKSKREDGEDVRRANVETLRPPDDERTKHPDHNHRRDIVSPLNAETGDGLCRQKEQHREAEVRWIPNVAALHAQHILRHDRDCAA